MAVICRLNKEFDGYEELKSILLSWVQLPKAPAALHNTGEPPDKINTIQGQKVKRQKEQTLTGKQGLALCFCNQMHIYFVNNKRIFTALRVIFLTGLGWDWSARSKPVISKEDNICLKERKDEPNSTVPRAKIPLGKMQGVSKPIRPTG